METKDYNAQEIFYDSRRFMVPIYQRKYQWDDTQLDPFWNDVEMKAAELIDDGKGFKHYMGALILLPEFESSQIAVTPKMQVVDGQQRLTTFQLFLAAIREIARKHNVDEIAEQTEGYLFNKPKPKDTEEIARFKLTPTPEDREVFHFIIDNTQLKVGQKFHNFYVGDRVPKNTPYRALRAYQIFCGKVDTFVHYETTYVSPSNEEESVVMQGLQVLEDRDTAHFRLEALLKALLEQMKLVVITLDEGDDPQIIFETLNSKGRPLLTMDLVRNNIFHRAEKEEDSNTEELFQKLWQPFNDRWWDQPSPFSRPKRPRIDHFLHHVLTAETGRKISIRELYSEYRAFAVPKGKQRFKSVLEELSELEKFVPTYETLEEKIITDSELCWIGRKLAAWQVTTAYPIVMQISVSDLDSSEKKRLYQMIYSYIVRRTISGLTGKNLNNVFQSLAREFVVKGTSLAVFRQYFSDKHGESTLFPNDDEFRRGILHNPAFNLAPGKRVKDILWELELASRTTFSEKTSMPDQLWTEHVLPQTWTEEWPFESTDSSVDEGRISERNMKLHTLGNLTLITDMLNISLGNKSFSAKKKELELHSGLFLNRWFVGKASWTEKDIHERGEHLAEQAVSIWPCL